ncbi:YbaB/EbfC family nucleoid-associated protein [Nonomuraea sp. NPDC002799]
MKPEDAANAGPPELFREVERLSEIFASETREAERRKVTGADGTGGVVATVSGSARLLNVRIAPRTMRDLDHVKLSQAVLEAVSAAREAAAEQLTEALGKLSGGRPQPGPEDDTVTRYVEAMLREAEHG